MLSKAFKTLGCLMLCVSILVNSFIGVAAAENPSPVTTATASYYSFLLRKTLQWDFAYSDQWFTSDPCVYSHPLARASLGMALSAFRVKNDRADAAIEHYLTQLGFTDLSSTDYDRATSIETISTMIGHKQLPSGETLLAVAICGQGYKNEWLSNFDIGNEQDHTGFSSSAEKVVKRVDSYMQEHGLTNVRLWMAGYSRAAAVANLTGAALMEKGLFNQQNAYVYTFATPRTTRKPVAYANIFNITGKFDPVAKVPYKEWGYERHGVNLYTPAQETDSDYRSKQAAADKPFYELTGLHLWNSPELNQHVALVESYLLANIPTAIQYDAHMSDLIAAVWSTPSVDAVLTLLRTMTRITGGGQDDDDDKGRTEEMLDYIFSAVTEIDPNDIADVTDEEMDKIFFAALIVLEHIPDVYLAWMYSSDDPAQIFSDNTEYVQLIISGDADVNVFDQRGGFILSVDPEGIVREITENKRYLRRIRPVEDRPLVTATTVEDRQMIVLPRDQGFPVTMIGRSASDLEYFALYHDTTGSSPSISSTRILHMQPGEEYLAFSLTPDGQLIMEADEPLWGDYHEIDLPFDSDELLSALEVTLLANPNATQLSVRKALGSLILFVIALAALLLLLALTIVIWVIRKLRRKSGAAKQPSRRSRKSVSRKADSGQA